MDTINTVLGGSIFAPLAMVAIAIGTICRECDERLHRLAVAPGRGLRVPRVASALIVAVLGFFFRLYLNSGGLLLKFENYPLFIIYWVTPWASVVPADWQLRGRRADVSRLRNFASLPSGALALVALVGYGEATAFIASTIPWP